MEILLVPVFFCAFLGAQFLLRKTRGILCLLPLLFSVAGLIFCLAAYLSIGITSPSVVAENQALATFLFLPVGAAFVGSVIGLLIQWRNRI